MKANVNINAGICGFQTKVVTAGDDDQNVEFQIETNC